MIRKLKKLFVVGIEIIFKIIAVSFGFCWIIGVVPLALSGTYPGVDGIDGWWIAWGISFIFFMGWLATSEPVR